MVETTFVWDLETSGLPKTPIDTQPLDAQPHIIQVFGQVIEHRHDSAEFEVKKTISYNLSTLHDYGMRVPGIITKITGITNNELVGCPNWSGVRDEFWSMYHECDYTVTHNILFDMRCAAIEEFRLGYARPKLSKHKGRCSLEASRRINVDAKSHALGNLYKHLFGEDLANTHTAEADVRGLTRVYLDLYKRGAWKR